MTTQTQLIEIAMDCPVCGDMILVKIATTAQVAELLRPCPACRVLTSAA